MSTCWALLRVTPSLDGAGPATNPACPQQPHKRQQDNGASTKPRPHAEPHAGMARTGCDAHYPSLPAIVPRPQATPSTWETPGDTGGAPGAGKGRERGEPRDEQNPATTDPQVLLFGFFFLFLSRPWRQWPRRAPHRSLQRRPHDVQGAAATLSRHYRDRRRYADLSPQPSPLLAALTSLRRRGAAPRPPLSSPVPPPAPPWPRPPQVRRSRREGAGEGPARGIRVRHTPPARAQGQAAGPMRAAAPAGSAPTTGRAGVRRRLREGGRKRWRAG